jgi:hypothetical protein
MQRTNKLEFFTLESLAICYYPKLFLLSLLLWADMLQARWVIALEPDGLGGFCLLWLVAGSMGHAGNIII